jgi:CBS domain-containing protein
MAEDREKEEKAGPPGADVLTKMTRVSQARSLAGDDPCAVAENMDLTDVARQMWQRRQVRTAAVVDNEGRLVGIIPQRLLLDELYLRVVPEEFISDVLESEGMEEMGKIVTAATAGELMEPPVYVALEDTVKDAFGRMHDHKLEGLPIVDEVMRPVGYLDRFQLLEVWIREHRSPGSSPT